ncbi:hypothetical protein ABZ569_32710 [Streptomyces albus]|uniref:hypothetical protein n=1 Tax=Streptomyces albus TaxID=1888 RepID=UPI0034023D89
MAERAGTTDLVLDPELPEPLRSKLRRLHQRGALGTDEEPDQLSADAWLFMGKAGGGSAAFFLLIWASLSDQGPLWLVFGVPAALLPVGIILYLLQRAGRSWYRRRHRRAVRRAAQGRFLLLDMLTGESRDLLGRALEAGQKVLASAAHRQGQLDQQRNNVVLPAQLWALARDLEEHQRLSATLPAEVSTAEGERAREASRAALRQYLESAEHRVVALEEYARQADRIDALKRQLDNEMREHEQLARTHSEILNLLARAEADGMAVEESEQLSAEAAQLSRSLADAVEAARDAAAVALPVDGD